MPNITKSIGNRLGETYRLDLEIVSTSNELIFTIEKIDVGINR